MYVLFIVESMVGAITGNFRRVAIRTLDPQTIEVQFLLERESTLDREEIEDIIFELSARMCSVVVDVASMDIVSHIIVDERPIIEIEGLLSRVVYGRKES